MDKAATRKILRQFADGQMTWRRACAELVLDDYSELMALMNEFEMPFPVFSTNATFDDFEGESLSGPEEAP